MCIAGSFALVPNANPKIFITSRTVVATTKQMVDVSSIGGLVLAYPSVCLCVYGWIEHTCIRAMWRYVRPHTKKSVENKINDCEIHVWSRVCLLLVFVCLYFIRYFVLVFFSFFRSRSLTSSTCMEPSTHSIRNGTTPKIIYTIILNYFVVLSFLEVYVHWDTYA